MASEQIVYYIIAKDQASKKFKDVGDASEKAGGRISGSFSKIGLLAGGAAVAIGAIGGAGLMMGIKTAAGLEQANIGFTTLLGSSQKAGQYVKDLQKFAANTPFEFQGLVDSSRLLLGVGVASQKVIPMLTDFGDAAGALGIQQDAFQRIMLATSQAISAGKFQVGDINQIVQAGIPVWSLLSKSLGKPVSELRKMSSQGKLTADVVLPALQRQMHKDYGGSMAKQSQTLAGLWSTFTDTLSQGLAQAILPLVPMLKSILPGAMNVMGAALAGVSKGFAWLMHIVQVFVAGFQNNTDQLVDMNVKWTDPVVNAGFKIRDVFDGVLVPAFKAVWTVAKGLINWWRSDLVPAYQKAAGAIFPALAKQVRSVSDTVKSNHATFVQVGNILKTVGMIITSVLIPVMTKLYVIQISMIGPAFKVFAAILGHIVIPAIRALVNIWFTVVGALVNGAAKAFGWVPGLGGKLKKAAKDFNQFRDDVNRALNGIQSRKEITIVTKANLGFVQTGATNKRNARASGGPVVRNQSYLVGEEGPELFVPGQSGGIVPAGQTKAMSGGGGGGQPIQLIINYVGGSTPAEQAKFGRFVEQSLQKLGRPIQVKTA